MADMDLVLHTDGPTLEFPPDTWRNDTKNVNAWQERIAAAVGFNNPWALLGMRPDGEVWVFGCSTDDIWQCAHWSVRVRLMFGPGQHWEDWE